MVLHARILLQQGNPGDAQTITLHERALELLEVVKEPIKFPSFWQQVLMQIDLLAQNTQELEVDRCGLHSNHSTPRSHPRPFSEGDCSQN